MKAEETIMSTEELTRVSADAAIRRKLPQKTEGQSYVYRIAQAQADAIFEKEIIKAGTSHEYAGMKLFGPMTIRDLLELLEL